MLRASTVDAVESEVLLGPTLYIQSTVLTRSTSGTSMHTEGDVLLRCTSPSAHVMRAAIRWRPQHMTTIGIRDADDGLPAISSVPCGGSLRASVRLR